MTAAQVWFTAGTIAFMAAGGGHALLTLVDTGRPTAFVPVDDSVRPVMDSATFRFQRMWPGATT